MENFSNTNSNDQIRQNNQENERILLKLWIIKYFFLFAYNKDFDPYKLNVAYIECVDIKDAPRNEQNQIMLMSDEISHDPSIIVNACQTFGLDRAVESLILMELDPTQRMALSLYLSMYLPAEPRLIELGYLSAQHDQCNITIYNGKLTMKKERREIYTFILNPDLSNVDELIIP
jgi:hypothetical protein